MLIIASGLERLPLPLGDLIQAVIVLATPGKEAGIAGTAAVIEVRLDAAIVPHLHVVATILHAKMTDVNATKTAEIDPAAQRIVTETEK